MKFSQKVYLKSYKILLTEDKLNMYQHYSNHQYHSTHLFDMLILKTLLMKKRTNDLALEINKVSGDGDTNNKESEHDHIMVTQSGDPNNKSKPAYKKYCSYCH